MKITSKILVGFASIFLISPSVHAAEAIEEKQIVAGKFNFDPQSAYMYLNGPWRQNGIFLKLPDQVDLDAYAKDWEAGLVKAQAKYVKQLARWEVDKRLASQTKQKPPEKPIEPTRENFSIGSIETRNSAGFGPDYVFSKDKINSHYSYLIKVVPGTYAFHGPVFLAPNGGYVGTCFCMGSIQVEVKAGTITDLGNMLVAGQFQTLPKVVPAHLSVTPEGTFVTVGKSKIEVGKIKFGLPESLKSFPSTVANFHASAKMDNHFGVQIGRMPAIPGIIGYKRDKVIDLKADAAPQ